MSNDVKESTVVDDDLQLKADNICKKYSREYDLTELQDEDAHIIEKRVKMTLGTEKKIFSKFRE